MDVWVVAAAAGAGYVAQRLKNLARGRNNWPDFSSKNLNFEGSEISQKSQGKSCSFRGVLLGKSLGEEIAIERERDCQDASRAEIASATAFEDEILEMRDRFGSCGEVSSSNSLAGMLDTGNILGNMESAALANKDEFIMGDLVPQPSSGEVGFSYGFRRNRNRLGNRIVGGQFIKPRTSLESCLMAQLYNEHAAIEEYTYSPRPLHKQKMRPFLVTDGSRVISRAPQESLSEQTETGKILLPEDTNLQVSKTVMGVPGLPNVVHLRKKAKAGKGKELDLRKESSQMTNINHCKPKGSTDEALLLYLGLTMGIMYSFLANKQEMEKLNKLLKQSQNLVQDLQEELEMKDSLTVKQLAVEYYESQDVHNDCYFDDTVCALSLERKLDESSRNCNEEHCDQNAEEKSKIEAELQAELERLDSNMNSARLEGKLANVFELAQDLVPDVAQGELRAEFFGAKIGNQPYADRDGSSNSTPHSANYPVSRKELSLRLHEVIQSRLEEQVKELEMALQNSQRKFKYMESGHMLPSRESSNNASPTVKDVQQSADEPVVINLAGEALAAYNEAYEELTKVSESDEEDVPFELENGYRVQNGGLNSYLRRHSLSDMNPETPLNRVEERSCTVSDDILCGSRDESEDGEDEMEKLLIRQIVEKARAGSPAVLNAQRALFSHMR